MSSNFLGKIFPAARLVATFPYTLVFKTTHFCWYNCAHCCENAGAHQPKLFMPADVIKNYLDAASNDSMFSREVVFTGGEIMSAYKFAEQGYVKDILNYALDRNMSVNIKTNAAWTRAGFGNQIFDELADIAAAHKPHRLQVSLSLDNFHQNAVDNNARFISEMASRKVPIGVHISGLKGKFHVAPDEVYAKVRARGIPLREIALICDDGFMPCIMAGDKVVILTSQGELFQAGRAEKMDGALHQETPEFTFLTRCNHVLMAFDNAGKVTLGEAARRKISTPWRTKNGTLRSIEDIRAELAMNTIWCELRNKLRMRGK